MKLELQISFTDEEKELIGNSIENGISSAFAYEFSRLCETAKNGLIDTLPWKSEILHAIYDGLHDGARDGIKESKGK